MEPIIKATQQSFTDTVEFFADRLKTVRTGRANPQLVENITVTYYGQPAPLRTLASIGVPEPMTIAIQPYDRNALDDIVLALTNAKDLGLTPNSDGTVVRLNLPPLTAERREQMAKQLHGMAEEARIALRNVREESWKKIQARQRDGDITEDDRERGRKQLDELIDRYNKQVADLLAAKEADIKDTK